MPLRNLISLEYQDKENTMQNEPEVIEGEPVLDEEPPKEIPVYDVTDKDEDIDPIPSSFLDVPMTFPKE